MIYCSCPSRPDLRVHAAILQAGSRGGLGGTQHDAFGGQLPLVGKICRVLIDGV